MPDTKYQTPNTFVLHVNALGELIFVYADELADLLADLSTQGECIVARASRVEPYVTVKGRQAWSADLSPVGGPWLGPFPLRSEALAAERKWLEENLV